VQGLELRVSGLLFKAKGRGIWVQGRERVEGLGSSKGFEVRRILYLVSHDENRLLVAFQLLCRIRGQGSGVSVQGSGCGL